MEILRDSQKFSENTQKLMTTKKKLIIRIAYNLKLIKNYKITTRLRHPKPGDCNKQFPTS